MEHDFLFETVDEQLIFSDAIGLIESCESEDELNEVMKMVFGKMRQVGAAIKKSFVDKMKSVYNSNRPSPNKKWKRAVSGPLRAQGTDVGNTQRGQLHIQKKNAEGKARLDRKRGL